MINHFSIRARVLLLTLLPSTFLACLLVSYFSWTQFSSLQGQLLQRGAQLSEQLAILAATPLVNGQTDRLEALANALLEHPGVRSARILDSEHRVLAHAGQNLRLSPPPLDFYGVRSTTEGERSRFLLPILGRHMTISAGLAQPPSRLIGWVELELSHQGALLATYKGLLTSLLLAFLALLATALLALRLARHINSPLQEIQKGVAKLREGQLSTRLPPLGSHELDQLASAFNRMAESLQNAQKELQHSIDQATEDARQNLESIEIQNIELDIARKEALESSRIKSEFLANMSHELRTPLSGILGFTQLLQKSPLTRLQQDYLSTIEQSADSLLGIINEVLDFSKIEAGKLLIEKLPFNLCDLIEDSLSLLAPSAEAKQLELVSLYYQDAPRVLQGDPQRLKQVLTNLINNAIKFTERGSVVVRTMLEESFEDCVQLRISVQDTGVGLSDHERRQLFQAFTQADNSLNRQISGTGLGLVISRRIIEQMGGEIGVISQSGEGSEFWISLRLPLGRDEPEHRLALPNLPVWLIEPQALSRQALQHQLHDLGLKVQGLSSLDELKDCERQQPEAFAAAHLLVLSLSLAKQPAAELLALLESLQRPLRHLLLLAPTHEQSQWHILLGERPIVLHSKPLCRRKLERSLHEHLQTLSPVSPSAAAVLKHSARVLCVDDNPANLLLVKTLLEDLGAQVCAVDNGQAALQACMDGRFELIFMDIQMPGLDGRQTTALIRQYEAERHLKAQPIIALTAHALASERTELMHSGMNDYLSKPINQRQLAQLLRHWTQGEPMTELTLSAAPHSAGPTLAKLAVLDHEEGLHLAAGKSLLAADMLGMLLASLPADLQVIRQSRAQHDWRTLSERVHRLHGATRYCGVPQLREACQRSEALLKQGLPGSNQALDELEQAIERLQETCKTPS